jgi:uncharacterized membrane protein
MSDEQDKPMPEHKRQGIDTVVALHARAQQAASAHHLLIERATLEIGRPRTLYIVLGVAFSWILANSLARHFGWPCLDPPPFGGLQAVVSLAALVLTTMVLTTQNRHAHISEARSHLELQVSLLADQKLAKVIQLVEELRKDLPMVRNRKDHVAEEMQETVDAGAMVEAIEQTLIADKTKSAS